MNLDRQEQAAPRPPLEMNMQSMDTLKEAVYAPQNEQAILSPCLDGPHANDTSYNLGAWSKHQEHAEMIEGWDSSHGTDLAGFPFPHRTSSMMQRQGFPSDNAANSSNPIAISNYSANQTAEHAAAVRDGHGSQSTVSSTTAIKSIEAGSSDQSSNRVSSMTSIDSHVYRSAPSYRIFSAPLEWKSASSIAQATGLASGHIANTQSEGVLERVRIHAPEIADIRRNTEHPMMSQQQRVVSVASEPMVGYCGRFREGSLDGITNPPNSPQTESHHVSPSISAKASPGKDSKKKDSPAKGTSPAKVKFERIAEKVGITVSVSRKDDDSSPSTPPGRRNWRNVWRAGAGKERSKDDALAVPTK
jgi:hypothetical protein